MSKKVETSRISVVVPKKFHKMINIKLAERGETLRNVVINLLSKWWKGKKQS